MKKVFAICLCLISFFVNAQEIVVSGKVTDAKDGSELIGCVVVITGTTIGTFTDGEGNYSINMPADKDVISFSYVGYVTQEVRINRTSGENKLLLSVQLQPSQFLLDDAVISVSKHKEKILDAPASVTLIKQEQIESNVTTSPVDHLRRTAGVDVIQQGLVSNNVIVRGFNNIFSGGLMNIVDNRIAGVPSLRVNAYQLIPTNNSDIQQIEVIRGPASALYGPNAASGVIHIFTKSPLDQKNDFEGTVSITAGERSIINPELRISQKFSDKFGFKLSGSYFQGNEWEYFDPREPAEGSPVEFGSVRNGDVYVADSIWTLFELDSINDTGTTVHYIKYDSSARTEEFHRDFNIERFSFDTRFDFRFNKETELIISAGLAQSSNIELTGLGAGQAINWVYSYAQARFRWENLFAQYFVNSSDAGDTYLIPQVSDPAAGGKIQYLVDKSKLHVFQLQHSTDLLQEKLELIYGFDALLTRPVTEGTINGRFDDDDNVNQYGGYLQAEYALSEKFSLIAASRLDYHDVINELMISPRGAVVFKANSRNTFRATYNRAFTSPTSLNLFLDLSNGLIPNGINVRGMGNPNGFNYHYDIGDPMQADFISPYDYQWYQYGDQTINDESFQGMLAAIAAGLTSSSGIDSVVVTNMITILTDGIATDTGTIMSVGQVAVDYVSLLETGDVSQSLWNGDGDISGITDLSKIESEITQTFEIGYKGILFDKLQITIDAYHTSISNFVSPLTLSTASIIFDPLTFNEAIGVDENGNPAGDSLLYYNLQGLDFVLTHYYDEDGNPLIDGNPDYGNGGIANGTAFDELVYILNAANQGLPLGSVTPEDSLVNTDIILVYRNLGTVNIFGGDLGFLYQVNENISVNGSFSIINKDRIALSGTADGYVALNAPKHKASLGLDWNDIANTGLGFGLNWRWLDSFPANSSVYVGTVEAANLLDARIHFKPKFSENTTMTLSATNVLDYKHQSFPGTPQVGRLILFRISQSF